MTAAAQLGALLAPDEAAAVAARLRLCKLPHLAAQHAYAVHRAEVKSLLSELIVLFGDPLLVAAVLDGIAAVPRTTAPVAVWTAPKMPGLEGHTTLAVATLINQATSSVYAATYSASPWADYVQALANAIERGVRVTVILDRSMQTEQGGKVPDVLAGARIWSFAPATVGNWTPRQHAKLVVVDRVAALVTSANFSDAAAKHNLECGLLSRDPSVAQGLVRQIKTLRKHGALVDY